MERMARQAALQSWQVEKQWGKSESWVVVISPETFEAWFTHARTHIERSFWRRGCERALVDDLTQETCARIWSCRDQFRGESEATFRGWAIQVARTIWLRHWSRHAPCPDAVTEDLADPAADPVALLARAELEAVLRTAIDELPPQMRKCVLLLCQGRTVREIAVVLRLRVGTVKAHLFHARAHLTRRLAGLRDGGAEPSEV